MATIKALPLRSNIYEVERGIHPTVEDEISIRSKVASGKELVGALVLIMKGGFIGLASLK